MTSLYPTTRRLTVVLVGLIALFGLSAPAQAQACSTGSAEVDLNVNNVRATLYNIGGLFWRGSAAQYEVPAGSGKVSIFASGIWLGGKVGGQLRFAGSTYGAWEYWPGPLNASGQVTAATCQQFDRFWKVNIGDIRAYNASGATTTDLAAWPIAYGAPFFVDTNGNGRRDPTLDADEDDVFDEPRMELDIMDAGYGSRQIDLAAGERPDIIGDQGIWWVMNDAGGSHDWGGTAAIGVEVRAQAFGFQTADALNNATFYRYQFIYRGSQPMTDTYVGIFSDPDLGDFNDDYVGSDPSLGLGFVYNGDAVDGGGGGYGEFPPALGYDFFQGPLVNDDGIDNDGDGETDEDDERLAVEKFFYFTNGGTVTSDPNDSADEAYSYMQGLWKDGTPLKEGGDGYNTNGPQVDFAFPGNPPEFWSEYNSDNAGTANNPADRRFGVSSGPFTFDPGEIQEVVFGIVWSQAVGVAVNPQIASVNKLKVDDATLQSAFDAQFALPEPPPPLTLTASGLDQEIVLEWDNARGTNADLFNYDVVNPFAPVDAADRTYTFEGFQVFQCRDNTYSDCVIRTTYDVANGITNIVDTVIDPGTGLLLTQVSLSGSDNGGDLRTPTSVSYNSDIFAQGPLRNATSYYFGVQAYAYNEASVGARVFRGPLATVEIRPTLVGATTPVAVTGSQLEGVGAATNGGEGSAGARVINPGAVTGDTYDVVFFTQNDASGNEVGTNYRIVNTTTGTVLFNGAAYYAANDALPPQRADAFRAEGLAFDVLGPDKALLALQERRGGVVIDPTLAFSLNSSTNPPRYFVSANGASPSAASIFSRTDWQGGIASRAPIDIEIRFVENPATNGQIVLDRTNPGNDPNLVFMLGWQEADEATFNETSGEIDFVNLQTKGAVTATYGRLPFQVWEVSPNGTERQVMAAILDDNGDRIYNPSLGQRDYSFGNSDAVYERIYVRNVPYNEAAMLADPIANGENAFFSDTAILTAGRILMVPFGGHSNLPAPGTAIRYVTSKPNLPGDVFTISTSDIGAVSSADLSADDKQAALDLMAITPNPYRGFSGYEGSGSESIARFVNMPPRAIIRIFTLSGTLVRTIEKKNPGSATTDWDLRTEAGLPVASGMYLIHVEAREASGTVIGERILKFGVIQRRTQLDVL